MAQFDSSMYRGVPAIDLSQATEGFERGMKLGDMVRQRKTQELEEQKQAAIKEAFNKSYETAPDGSQVFNPMKLKDLVRGAGYGQDAEMLAADYQKKALEEQKLNFEKQGTKILGGYQLMNTVKDQRTLENARREALSLGYTQDEIDQNLPSVYDPQTIGVLREQLGQASIPYAQKIENQRKAQEAEARLAEAKQRNAIDYARLGIDQKRLENEVLKESVKSTPAYKVANLNTSDKARLDNIKLGVRAGTNMDQALADGDNTFTIVGDNKYTLSLDQMAEAFGRMQSGGAVNKDEEERFKRMSPTAKDSKEIQAKKLAEMRTIFTERLDTLGLKPEDVGIKIEPMKYAQDGVDPNTPQPGTEKRGYIFMGGDPSDQKNWKKK